MSEEKTEEQKEIVKVEDKKTNITIDQSGFIRPQNIEEAYRLSTAFLKSGMVPARFKTAESVLVAIQMALELGLKPLTALRSIAVIQGTPSFYGDLPLSLCYSSGKLESIKEYFLDKEGKKICVENNNISDEAYAAVCVVKRFGDVEFLESTFSLDDATRAGLFKNPVWKSYTKRMLKYRARSQALKDKFSDALNGISILEYNDNTIIEEIEKKQPSNNKKESELL